VLRDSLRRGCNHVALSICRGRSGDAFINQQLWNSFESALIAMLDCVCGSIFPARAATQFTQAQFHCGKPPPAALPRIWIRINRTYDRKFRVRSDRAGVTGAFKKDRHCFERRFDPPFFRSHESLSFN
jgi:hypothetical protein